MNTDRAKNGGSQKIDKPEKTLPGHGTVTFSVRVDARLLEAVQKEAELIGYSANQFFVQSAQDAVTMIQLPPGKPMKLPKLVAIGRYLKQEHEDLLT